jgi:ABC-2 type transport system permease protein
MSHSPATVLLRSYLRRDRTMLAAWIAGGCLLYVSQAKSVEQMYPTPAALEEAAQNLSSSPAMLAMTGPARALDTLGGQVAWQTAAFGAVVAGLMSMLIVGRHTRVEEETGRDELVRSGAVGRLTPLALATVLALAANVVLGTLTAASLIASGLPAAGSVALGAALSASGWVFTGVSAVAAQLTAGARASYAVTGSVIGAAYFARAVGDTGPHALSWASPIGWGQATRPYADERWWPLALSVLATALLLLLAVRLHAQRDHGSGVWSDRPPRLRDADIGSWHLAWHLQRGGLLGWGAATAVVGLGYGALATSAEDVVGDSQFTADLFAGPSVTDGFLGTALLVLALLAAAAGVMAAQRPDAEERLRRVDPLLAGPLTRATWSLQHVALSTVSVVLLLLVAGLSSGLGYAVATGDPSDAWSLVGAALAYAPAALTLTAVVRFAHGMAWSASIIGWLAVGWCAVIAMFGPLLDLPAVLTGLSPFEHVARMPAEPFAAATWAVLWCVAVLVSAAGQALLAHRDLR